MVFNFLLSFVKLFKPDTIHGTERITKPVYDFMREEETSHLLVTTEVSLGQVSGLFCFIVKTFVCRTVQSLSTGWSSSVAWAVDATPHVQKKQNCPTMLIQLRLHRAAPCVCTPGGSWLICLYATKNSTVFQKACALSLLIRAVFKLLL